MKQGGEEDETRVNEHKQEQREGDSEIEGYEEGSEGEEEEVQQQQQQHHYQQYQQYPQYQQYHYHYHYDHQQLLLQYWNQQRQCFNVHCFHHCCLYYHCHHRHRHLQEEEAKRQVQSGQAALENGARNQRQSEDQDQNASQNASTGQSSGDTAYPGVLLAPPDLIVRPIMSAYPQVGVLALPEGATQGTLTVYPCPPGDVWFVGARNFLPPGAPQVKSFSMTWDSRRILYNGRVLPILEFEYSYRDTSVVCLAPPTPPTSAPLSSREVQKPALNEFVRRGMHELAQCGSFEEQRKRHEALKANASPLEREALQASLGFQSAVLYQPAGGASIW